MKATVVLLPLLSITSIFFLWGPDRSSITAYYAYRITNACLQVAQVLLSCLSASMTLYG